MDSLHAIGFYVSSGVLLLGGLGVALLPGRDLRGIALAVSGAGLAGAYVSLSAGFAAIVALVCYLGCAAMVAGPGYRVVQDVVSPVGRQAGGVGAGALVALGAFAAAWRRDVTAAVAAIPVMFAGAGIAFAGVARFAAAGGSHLLGQELAVLLAIAAVALVALGLGIAGREGAR